MTPVTNLTETERAYLAGIIDGEGCVTVHRKTALRPSGEEREMFQLAVVVSNSGHALMEWLEARFPDVPAARLNSRTRRGDGGGLWKPTWDWKATNRKAIPVLEAARPYLVLKARQADLALEMAGAMHNHGRRGYPEAVQRRRREIVAAIRDLNRKGVAA